VSGIPESSCFEEIILSVDNLVGNILLDILSYKGIPCALEISSRGYLLRFYPRNEGEKEKLRSTLRLFGEREIDWKERFLFSKDFLNWKKYFKPVHFKKVVVKPPWENVETEKEVVIISPGLAFGTGNHPSTKLAISLIEELIKGGEKVLDIGTGSGILSIVALKLGAEEALAIDRDSFAIENAILNGKLNGVAEKLKVRRKEAKEVRKDNYDIILANLDAFQLKKLAEFLCSFNFIYLVVSGIRANEEGEIRKLYKSFGFKERKKLEEEGWVAILFES
jgi:ribosomal protein L11 methyltransferase